MRYLTAGEAAEALNLSVPTIKRYLYEGKLNSTKLPGGQHRIPESEIDRLLSPAGADGAPATEGQPCAEVDRRVDVLEQWVTELQAEVERLHATLEVMSRYCSGVQEGLQEREVEAAMSQGPRTGHTVTILGPGCRRCDALYEAARQAIENTGREDVTVERITHLDDIVAYGPILTPALVVDDKIVLSGRVPSEEALAKILSRHLK